MAHDRHIVCGTMIVEAGMKRNRVPNSVFFGEKKHGPPQCVLETRN